MIWLDNASVCKLKIISCILFLSREIGGTMCPLWPQYYEDCKVMVFVVDASDAASIAPATLELYELMLHPKLQVIQLHIND